MDPVHPRVLSPRTSVPRRPIMGRGTAVRSMFVASAAVLMVLIAPGTRSSDASTHSLIHGRHQAQTDPATPTEQFEQLLGHHAFLMSRSMRASVANQPNAIRAFEDALVKNTEDLATLVGSVYGLEHVSPFRQLWYSHVFLLNDYASAAARGDEAARAAAQAGLEEYRTQYGSAVEALTGGAIPAPAAAENLRAHVDHLTAQLDAYLAGDAQGAYGTVREGYAHMFPTAAALASSGPTPTPGELPTPVASPPSPLRSRLSMLLGEHFELAIDATRSGLTGGADFSAAAEALNANTLDLTAAFDSLFGADRAAAFNELWATHIDNVVSYTVAAAQGDEAGKQAARDGLDAIAQSLAAAFSDLTAGAVPVDQALMYLTAHDAHLIEHIDAYAAGDFDTAHQLSFDGYRHMTATAAALAPGIEAALAGVAPLGGVATGGGGFRWLRA